MRSDKRKNDELREVKIETDYIKYAEGSCLFQVGNTKVICTASVEDGVPPFLRGQGTGWVTSEYGMLPRSCHSRVSREATKGKKSGRTHEIQRLIGRVLRGVVDMKAIGERTIWIDCDVIQADGGTRCASITGSFIALYLALNSLKKQKVIDEIPVKHFVSAISVGIVGDKACLDLSYDEDSNAEVDMNIAMTDSGEFVEIQGTAEGESFTRIQMNSMIELAEKGITCLIEKQKSVLNSIVQ